MRFSTDTATLSPGLGLHLCNSAHEPVREPRTAQVPTTLNDARRKRHLRLSKTVDFYDHPRTEDPRMFIKPRTQNAWPHTDGFVGRKFIYRVYKSTRLNSYCNIVTDSWQRSRMKFNRYKCCFILSRIISMLVFCSQFFYY